MKILKDAKSFVKSAFYSGKAISASNKRNYDKALEYNNIVLDNIEEDDPLIPDILKEKAEILFKLKKYEEAFENATKSFDMFSRQKNPDQETLNSIKELKTLIESINIEKHSHNKTFVCIKK